MSCDVCGIIDPAYKRDPDFIDISHQSSVRHICNQILYEYKYLKKTFSKNRDGIFINGYADNLSDSQQDGAVKPKLTDKHKIIISVKPGQKVKFGFDIKNDAKKEDLLIIGIHLGHPQPQFVMSEHPYKFGEEPHLWLKKTSIEKDISVMFTGGDIGQYEMPIMFTFHRQSVKKNIIFIREMVVMVTENSQYHAMIKPPYSKERLPRADSLVPARRSQQDQEFPIPHVLKILFPRGLDERALDGLQKPPEVIANMRAILIATRAIFDEGITEDNYMMYFHHLLWWEETIVRINLRKFNMDGVPLHLVKNVFVLEVPGLAEKRPSVLRGDRVYLQPKSHPEIIFESVIKNIDDNYVHLGDLSFQFSQYYSPDEMFMVRFIMSRVPFERSHEAISRLFTSKQECRVFPEPTKKKDKITVKRISKFYNDLLNHNEEQRSAVEHIVSGTSGKAPYIVFGPPGTGKTMTIVEAIIQLVARNPRNRVMVCTDSNMAADHIALMLLKYRDTLNINNFVVRANSQNREWSVMPEELAKISNGISYETFRPLSNAYVSTYRIMVTTLLHAAKFASVENQRKHKLQMSHLFIDEAAQASEPHSLVPITGLLAASGQLILAGDPQQLGPVCISREANWRGLGTSLLERLIKTHENLYENNPNYMTMLVKNFRNNPDILTIPNKLFYEDRLVSKAVDDPISRLSILDVPGGNRAVVFHAVHSKEQRMGNAPSFFNEKELDMLKRYILTLINKHKVAPEQIGVIAPYIRQVYKVKAWLNEHNYEKIEVGTVEAFQGKEKRVILVSTVRANCRLLDYDAMYGLGFLADDKRFNVTLTRAKAKLIIIGNPTCLMRDIKWNDYMDQCKDFGCYLGEIHQQLDRTEELLNEVAKIRFNKCGLTNAIEEKKKERKIR